ncbi:MAG: hypothetical protein D3918_11530 [Candidatus Electrothrix sp. AX2]|nr:hypothetical protein [Candidatus Electrothrix gigas]
MTVKRSQKRGQIYLIPPLTPPVKKLLNNLINADHYHGGESKFIGFAKVPVVIKFIADYPWQVIKTLGASMPGVEQI